MKRNGILEKVRIGMEILSIAITALVILSGLAAAAVITVDDNGGSDFTSIYEAVNAANIGDEINIYSGTYNVPVAQLEINKKISLVGIDNGGGMPVVIISDGIKLIVDGCTIKGLNISHIQDGSGIFIWSSWNTIQGNVIRTLDFPDNNNRGIDIGYGNFANNNLIYGNVINNNNIGIRIGGSNNNRIIDNSLSHNDADLRIINSNNNLIHHNKFLSSSYTVSSYGGTNQWDDGVNGGNAYASYTGSDANNDGIGDIPYDIPGGTDRDRYPLILDGPKPEIGKITTINVYPANPIYRKEYAVNVYLKNTDTIPHDFKIGLQNSENTVCSPAISPVHTFQPGETIPYGFICKTSWDWIPPGEEGYGIVEKGVIEAVKYGGWETLEYLIKNKQWGAAWDSFITVLETTNTLSNIKAVKTYNVALNSESTPGITMDSGVNQNVVVEVPLWYKKMFLIESSILTLGAQGVDIIPGAGPLFGALDKVMAYDLYRQAYDPDFNYVTVQEPIPMYLPELDSVPDRDAKKLALATADLASLREAIFTAYVRYDAAMIDDQPDYMLMQLEAANNYTLQSVQKTSEIAKYSKLVTASMEPLTDEQIQQFRTEIQTNGLPQEEIDILTRNGLGNSIENITQMVLNTDPEIYRNPKNYTRFLDLQATMLASESAGYVSEIVRIKVEEKGLAVTTASDEDISNLENLKSQIQSNIDQGTATPEVKAQTVEMISKATEVLGTTNNITYKSYYEFAVNALAVLQSLDEIPPEITIARPIEGEEILLNNIVFAQYSVADVNSGIDTITATTPDNSAIDTATVGVKTFIVNARDVAGNEATRTVSYKVIYNFSILPPINSDGTSVFRLGSIVPVKFQIRDSAGNIISNAVAKLNLTKTSDDVASSEIEAISSGNANEGNEFRYSAEDELYIFNLKTKDISTGTYQLKAILDDNSTHIVDIGVK